MGTILRDVSVTIVVGPVGTILRDVSVTIVVGPVGTILRDVSVTIVVGPVGTILRDVSVTIVVGPMGTILRDVSVTMAMDAKLPFNLLLTVMGNLFLSPQCFILRYQLVTSCLLLIRPWTTLDWMR